MIKRPTVASDSDHYQRPIRHTELQSKVESCKKKLKVSQQSSWRLTKKVKSLENIISVRKEKNLVSDHCVTVLEKCLSGASLQLVLRQLAKSKHIEFSDPKYLPELRAFALTLNFYSAKAYSFAVSYTHLTLPTNREV